jgi:UDP-2,4-diacetamido-2,4,6-trideoxy-beta-L-altropyranose hydrolase
MFVVNDDTGVINLIERYGLEVMGIAESPGQLQPTLQILADQRASVLVTDSSSIKSDFLSKVRGLVQVLVALDDLADRSLPVDIVVNAAIDAEKLRYSTLTDARLLLGPAFALLRNEFANAPVRSIRPRLERLLVTVGGSDGHNLTGRLVEWARQVLPDAMLEVVIGPFFAEIPEVVKTKMTLHRNPQNMRDLMLACDLALCSGGQTTYELAATGTPAIAVQIAENQKHNLEGFVGAGTLAVAGSIDDHDMEHRVKSELESLASDSARRAAMSQRGRALVDGRGAARAADAIMELARGRNDSERL